MMRFAEPLAIAAAVLAAPTSALAHPGHGLAASHWHATDVSGFLFVAVLATIAIWLSRDE